MTPLARSPPPVGQLGGFLASPKSSVQQREQGLQIPFTVDDRNVFNTQWSAAVTYRRAGGWVENVRAENTHAYYNNGFTKVPQADKPDF